MDIHNDTTFHGDEEMTSEHEYLTLSLYITLCMLCIFSLFGVIGNALVLYVYVQKRDRLTSTFFIIVLAAIDFVTCLVIIPYTVYLEYKNFTIHSDISCKIYQFLVSSNIPFSVFIMVAIALDRYFCICHPFLQAITMCRAQIISVVMGLYAAVLGSLVACMFGLTHFIGPEHHYNSTQEMTSDQNTTMLITQTQEIQTWSPYCTKSNVIFSDEFIDNYRSFHVAQYVTSLVCIMVLYTMIYHKVHSRRVQRLRQSQNVSLPMVPRTTTTYTQDTEITNIHLNNGDRRVYDEKSPCLAKARSNEGSPVKGEDADKSDIVHNIDEIHVTPSNGETVECADDKKENNELLHVSPQNSIKRSPEHSSSVRGTKSSGSQQRKSSRRERLRAANIKTAIMLSVVTVVFVITYAPAFIMMCFPKIAAPFGPASFRKLFHYMYFANNVANPIIYSFMNPNFRADLKKIFTKRY
jgi:cholecystokinin A receptor/hypocretin (orexin) receptor 2